MATVKNEPSETQEFNSIKISLASPDVIRSWSFGEVTKPETINYRTFKPERDGLFCERIFGPIKDWECSCGKYKGYRFKGVVCDRCGVEITRSSTRRERMGHIELAVPVTHIWFVKSLPSRIRYMTEISSKDLEEVIYYESYIVIDPMDTELEFKQILSDEEYRELKEKGLEFEAKMGGEAIHDLLAKIDIEEFIRNLRENIRNETSTQRKNKFLKTLQIAEAFSKSTNKPEWMCLKVIPVIPPDLRPLVPLEGGRFATSDLNDLYRRLINRNNRLKKLIEIMAPEVILRNEKRMLQNAVDALIDNSRRRRAILGRTKQPLKSLTDQLKGKQGRFRQNLLGKRVDYSGRAVIVVGPELKLNECGIPKNMALELFKPFILRKLEEKRFTETVKASKKFVAKERPEIWDILEEIIKDHPVLLNRAPTLHRLGIEAFYPRLIEGKAIRIPPMVCNAFNADFDGDQMAVHIPLSFEAQLEARILMLSSNNLLSPAHGKPLASPTQDLVLGCYFLTKKRPGKQDDEKKIFSSTTEVLLAYSLNKLELHKEIQVKINGELTETTCGRVIFNESVPPILGFQNQVQTKSTLQSLVKKCFDLTDQEQTTQFLDSLKELGYKYATVGSISIGIDDLIVPAEKSSLIEKGKKQVALVNKQYQDGVLTEGERYNKVIEIWTRIQHDITDKLFGTLAVVNDGFNPLAMMVESGARGSQEQVRQLCGIRGLMSKPQKKLTGMETIETPIISNFREGLTVLEYFLSTHGARKGLADTALKTADAGYLTRKLVDVAQDVVVTIQDCGTVQGIWREAIKEGEDIIIPLRERIEGRVSVEDIFDPTTDEILVNAGELIDHEKALLIEDKGIERVLLRSVLTCEARKGVCVKCYGLNLATNRHVEVGEAVGIIAGESIGEPGTQLTLRTFHYGGTASVVTAQSEVVTKYSGTVSFQRLRTVKHPTEKGKFVALNRTGEIGIVDEHGLSHNYKVPYGATIEVNDETEVTRGEVLYKWEPYINPIISEITGNVKFEDIIDDVTIKEKVDVGTMTKQNVIIDFQNRTLHPRVVIEKNGKKAMYSLPIGAHLQVKNGDTVKAGEPVAKLLREISKTKDITGGLPRVEELFEARHPKNPAIVSEIDGIVKFQKGRKSKQFQKITIAGSQGEKVTYSIRTGRHILVQEGDSVRAGDRLCDGPIDPHDILRIKGDNAARDYLLNEIQEVYRMQGVTVNSKHIEVIVRQMLRKVKILNPGNTPFIQNTQVDKLILQLENERVIGEGGEPANYTPILLGITKASLSTESYLSAASFQETTRVLTAAAIEGKIDELTGLKENVTIGRLIPAGTGFPKYKKIQVEEINEMDEDKFIEENFDIIEEEETLLPTIRI
ncbi:DNA-directed RNA polymerase subunit beta' [bacterium]|nr:DNA-directed RNA polymerase subunit beta' [bacterium]